jgi:hypothetical protein
MDPREQRESKEEAMVPDKPFKRGDASEPETIDTERLQQMPLMEQTPLPGKPTKSSGASESELEQARLPARATRAGGVNEPEHTAFARDAFAPFDEQAPVREKPAKSGGPVEPDETDK